MNLQEKKSILLLSRVPGVGTTRLRALISKFQSPDKVMHASIAELSRTPNVGQATAEAILRFLHSPERSVIETKIDEQFELLQKYKGSLISLWDEAYPNRLKEIYDAPIMLFVRGEMTDQDERCLSIVGTRYPSDYGKNVVKKITGALVRNGFTIVSGLAFGIDTLVHQTALDSGGRTIAVLGNGVDNIYTDTKGKLYPKILENGAILSEEWMGTAPIAENFPKRNRLISGLSLGSIIIESDIKGGAMLTAKYAIDQNRDVFALPGSIFSAKSNGTNQLIRDGLAKLVLTVDDILQEYQSSQGTINPLHTMSDVNQHLTFAEQKIISILNHESVHIDQISEQTGLDVSDVLVHLFELEMKNMVKQLAGKMFQKI